MLGKVQGRRRRGRQRIRWLEGVAKETGKSLRELSMLAQDRTAWRKYVRGVTRSRERLDGTKLKSIILSHPEGSPVARIVYRTETCRVKVVRPGTF